MDQNWDNAEMAHGDFVARNLLWCNNAPRRNRTYNLVIKRHLPVRGRACLPLVKPATLRPNPAPEAGAKVSAVVRVEGQGV
jgi:hypothetical protein